MPNINLLPWRDERRQQQLKQYHLILGGVAFAGLLLVVLVVNHVDHLIEQQTARNDFLQQQVNVLDQQLKKIKTIKKQKQALQLKINLIQQLQQSRNLSTEILSHIVQVTPPGIYIENIKRKKDKLKIIGKSESNNRLSEMMRRIKATHLLSQPAIESIVAAEKTSRPVSKFVMSLKITPNKKQVTGKGGNNEKV